MQMLEREKSPSGVDEEEILGVQGRMSTSVRRARDGCIDSYRLPFSIERPSPRRQLLLGAGGGGRMATAIESLVNDDDDGDEGVLDGCTVSSLHSH